MLEIDQLDKLLNGADEELKIKGLQLLEGVTNAAAFRLALKALGDESWRVRKAAIDLVAGYGDVAKVVHALVGCMRSEDNAGLRNAAAEAIEKIGKEALSPLLEVIDDEDHDLRKLVIDVLGNIGDERVTPYLIKALSDPDENVKSAAAENLGKVGDDEAVGSLLDVLKSDDLLLKFSSLEALSKIGKAIPAREIIPHLKNPLLKKAAQEVLGESKDIDAVPHLLSGVEDRSKSVKETALAALVTLVGSLPEQEDAVDLLKEKKGHLSEQAAQCLGSGKAEIASSALKFLGWAGSTEFIPKMIPLALDEVHAPLVAEVITAFGLSGEDALVKSYDELDASFRPFICYMLGEIGSAKGVHVLLSALGSDVGHVRHSAATSLGKIGECKAIFPLSSLLDDDYVDVQEAAVMALMTLAKSDRKSVVSLLKKNVTVDLLALRRNCAKILSGIAEAADFELALSFLKDEDAVIRKSAVESLAAIGSDGAARQIVLALSDEERDVRISAVASLGQIKYGEAMRPLLSLLQDEDIWVKSAVIRALAKIAGNDAAPHIAGLLNDEVGLTVITALETLGEMALPEYGPSMLETMKRSDKEIVKAAIENLAFFEEDAFMEQLSLSLNHEIWEVRGAAVNVLGQKGTERAFELLKNRLKEEEDDLIRQAIEKALVPGG